MKYIIMISILMSTLISCSGMQDDIKQYLDEGEKIYVGKLDYVETLPGKNRITIVGMMPYGVTQNKCVISWVSPSGEPKTQEFPVVRETSEDIFSFEIKDLEEGQHDFKIITQDAKGNSSIIVDIGGYSYGEIYQSTLSNRNINSISVSDEGEARVNWLPINNEQFFGCEIEYDKEDGITGVIEVDKDAAETLLPDYKAGGVLRWRSLYLPDPLAIDLFYTDWEEMEMP